MSPKLPPWHPVSHAHVRPPSRFICKTCVNMPLEPDDIAGAGVKVSGSAFANFISTCESFMCTPGPPEATGLYRYGIAHDV